MHYDRLATIFLSKRKNTLNSQLMH